MIVATVVVSGGIALLHRADVVAGPVQPVAARQRHHDLLLLMLVLLLAPASSYT